MYIIAFNPSGFLNKMPRNPLLLDKNGNLITRNPHAKQSMKKSICIAVYAFPVRSETFVTEHAVGLARRGWNVTVVSLFPGLGIKPFELEAIDATGVRREYCGNPSEGLWKKLRRIVSVFRNQSLSSWHLRLRRSDRSKLSFSARYLEHFRKIDPDVIHIHFAYPVGEAISGRWTRSPIITTWHGYDANVIPHKFGKDFYECMFARAEIQHTVGSKFMQQRVIDLGCAAERISLIPMGVDTEKFSFLDRSKLHRKTVSIISVGRLCEVKGHEYLIRAFKVLKEHGRPVQLTIVGAGELQKYLEVLISELGLEGHVKLAGSRQSIALNELLHDSDIFALTGVPSPSSGIEGQGIATVEAQLTGLPVVSSNIGGLSESMLDGESALLCTPKSIKEIASALDRYVKDPELRHRHGECGRRFAERRFSIEHTLDSFEAIYAKASKASG